MNPGDLLGSGTISGTEKDSRGCLLELNEEEPEPIQLPDGTERRFLQDGDELTMTAYCEREGVAFVSALVSHGYHSPNGLIFVGDYACFLLS